MVHRSRRGIKNGSGLSLLSTKFCIDFLPDYVGLIQARREGVDPSAFAWTFEQVLLAKVDGEVVRQQRVAKRMVKLHVYHVSLGGFVKGLNLVLPKKVLGGVYHAGVEIDGNEWSYGFLDTDETGVTPW